MTKTQTHRRRASCVLAFISTLVCARTAAADSLTLQWDLNSEPEVTGYLVYIGTQPGVYSQTVDVQNVDTYQFTTAAPGQQYCFAVAAYAGSLVSPLSAEVCGVSNDYPTLANPGNQAGRVGQSSSLQLSGSDPEGGPVSYSATGLPPGLDLSAGTGAITGVPTAAGTFTVTVAASDGVLSAQEVFTWVIQSAFQNTPPTLGTPGSLTSTVGQQILLQLQGADADGDPLTYSASGLPDGLQVTADNGRISGSPTTAGSYGVTISVSDGRVSTSQSFSWTINAVSQNAPPVLTSPGNQTATVGQATALQLQANDPNGDALTFSASGLPAGLQINSSTGRIAGTPTASGTSSVTVTVSDGALSASRTFTWTVAAANVAPTMTAPGNQNSTVGQAAVLQLQASDANFNVLTYSATGLPPGMQIATTTGRIAGTPTTAGTYNVSATVSDGALTASRSFTWTVAAANVAPVMTAPGNQTGVVGQATALQLQATDANNNTLTYSATGLPTGLQITASSGRIAGTPTAAGLYNVTATVSDGSLTASRTFTWSVSVGGNVAPVLTAPGNQTSTVGQAVTLQLQASDANGNALTYGAAGLPPGLQITAGNGRITGTPTTVSTYSVTATVSDGSLSAQQSFTWTVVAAIAAPAPSEATTTTRSTKKASSGSSYTGSSASTKSTNNDSGNSKRKTGTDAVSRTTSTSTTTDTAVPSTFTGSTAVTRSVAGATTPQTVYTSTAVMSQPQTTTTGSMTTTSQATRSMARDTTPAVTQVVTDVADAPAVAEVQTSAPVDTMAAAERRVSVTAPSTAPSVSIETPVNRTTVPSARAVIFSGLARDAEDGDLTSRIVWTSSRDGRIGTGGLFSKQLSVGTHTITASVTDSKGTTRTAQVIVIVTK